MLFKRKHLRLKVCIFGYCFCGSPLPESNFLEILGQPPLSERSHRPSKNSSPLEIVRNDVLPKHYVSLVEHTYKRARPKAKKRHFN